MPLNLPKRGRLLEFVLATVLIGGLSLFLIKALKSIQDDGERLVVELTIRNMNSGLYLLQAERISAGRIDTLGELAEQNPVQWLDTLPPGYIGEADCAGRLQAGQWCWDKTRRLLYYYPKQQKWLKKRPQVPYLTWQVTAPRNATGFRPGSFRLQSQDDAEVTNP
jgi:hypothetical protein